MPSVHSREFTAPRSFVAALGNSAWSGIATRRTILRKNWKITGKAEIVLQQGVLAGIQNASGIGLRGVAAAARIDQIFVITDTAGCFRARLKMFDTEGVFAYRMPPFAPQKVNTAKLEFIPQPWLIRLVVQIPKRAVTTDVYQQRILDCQ